MGGHPRPPFQLGSHRGAESNQHTPRSRGPMGAQGITVVQCSTSLLAAPMFLERQKLTEAGNQGRIRASRAPQRVVECSALSGDLEIAETNVPSKPCEAYVQTLNLDVVVIEGEG